MRWIYLAAALLEMVLIFLLSSRPGSEVGLASPWDKLAHGLAYLAMGWLWCKATGRLGLAWAICAVYGLSDEWHQSMVPGRVTDLGDWVADGLGAALGVVLARFQPVQHQPDQGR